MTWGSRKESPHRGSRICKVIGEEHGVFRKLIYSIWPECMREEAGEADMLC